MLLRPAFAVPLTPVRACVVALALVGSCALESVAEASASCLDYQNQCYRWALKGECEANPEYMQKHCSLSCGTGVCTADLAGAATVREASKEFAVYFKHALEDTEAAIEILWVPPNWRDKGTRPSVVTTIPRSGVQSVNTFDDHVFLIREAGSEKKLAVVRMHSGRNYIVVDKAFLATRNGCADFRDDCKRRAQSGECVGGPGWMTVNCPKSCHACALRLPENRCPRHTLNVDQAPVYGPGDIQALFEGLVERFPQYNVTVHSREPWVVTFDNFVSEEEIQGLLGTVGGKFARSTDQGGFDERGVQQQITSSGRTSENAWCMGGCQDHPATLAIEERIRNVTNIPVDHYERFQVLSYMPGQFYNAHNDMADKDNKMPAGPRILTFFLYFSDVEEGGETAFPQLGLNIKPKKGSAVLWPDVKADNPTDIEPKTLHQAVAVKKGHKVAANAWIHLWNWREPNRWGCTGSFT